MNNSASRSLGYWSTSGCGVCCQIFVPKTFSRSSYRRNRRPEVAILDEATSCLDAAIERKCYELCLSAGITCLSVGHKARLRQFHDVIIPLVGDGSWRLESCVDIEDPEEVDVCQGDDPVAIRSPNSRRVSVAEDLRSSVRPHCSHKFDAVFAKRFWALFKIGFGDVVRISSVVHLSVFFS